jgi:hypothetical protein
MGKVIVITNPRPTKPDSKGTALVYQTDSPNEPNPTTFLEFKGGPYTIGAQVGFIMKADGSYNLGQVIGQSSLATGTVTQININSDETNRCEMQVERLCDPNPFGVKMSDKLQFKAFHYANPQIGENVALIPTAFGYGDITAYLENL